MLTDIRCGCGGVCDSGELCPMRGNVMACTCAAAPTHGPAQHDLVEWLTARCDCAFDPDHLYHDHEAAQLVEDSCERCTHGLFCPMHDEAGR